MAQINMEIKAQKEPEIAAWLESVNIHYPRYAGAYALAALKHYATTGSYQKIATVGRDIKLKEKYYLSISPDPLLGQWISLLKENRIKIVPIIKEVIKGSITFIDGDGSEVPPLIELLDIPRVNKENTVLPISLSSRKPKEADRQDVNAPGKKDSRGRSLMLSLGAQSFD